MDSELAKQHVGEPDFYTYSTRDAIVYALGVGASTRPDEVKFVYEGAEDFCVLPTFVVTPGMKAFNISDWPGVKFDLQKILHGEQYIEVYKTLPTDGELKSVGKVVDILDKGSGALILSNVETFDAKTGDKLAMQQFSTFQVGYGKFGGSKSSPVEIPTVPVPKRVPDAVLEQATNHQQAALYRQGSMDYNPLHVDSEFAKMSGFQQPILHGLCSLGFSVRHVLKQYANNDTQRFKAVKVRFSKPVIPGQTLRTEMWKQGNRIHFQTKVKETNETVLSSAYVDLKDSSDIKIGGGITHSVASNVQSAAVFKEIAERLKGQPDLANKIKAIIFYVIKQNGKDAASFTVDLKNGAGAVYEGEPKNGEKANTTLTVDDADFVQLATGKLNPQQAFMSGKIKVKGNIMLLQKLQGLMDHKTNGAVSPKSSSVQSAAVFKEIGERLKGEPDLAKKIKAIILYVIKQNGKETASFTVDLKNGTGAVYEGEPKNGEKANTTLTVDDADFVQLATGKLNPQQAFMSGKIKVKGNIMLLQKLQGLMAQKAKL